MNVFTTWPKDYSDADIRIGNRYQAQVPDVSNSSTFVFRGELLTQVEPQCHKQIHVVVDSACTVPRSGLRQYKWLDIQQNLNDTGFQLVKQTGLSHFHVRETLERLAQVDFSVDVSQPGHVYFYVS